MYYKKEMNLNSLYHDCKNDIKQFHHVDSEPSKMYWQYVYSQEERSKIDKNLEFNMRGQVPYQNITNIYDFYCIWNTLTHENQQIMPLNSFVMNNFWGCSDENMENNNMNFINNTQFTHYNFSQICQESEFNNHGSHAIEGPNNQVKVMQYSNIQNESRPLPTDRDFTQFRKGQHHQIMKQQ